MLYKNDLAVLNLTYISAILAWSIYKNKKFHGGVWIILYDLY